LTNRNGSVLTDRYPSQAAFKAVLIPLILSTRPSWTAAIWHTKKSR